MAVINACFISHGHAMTVAMVAEKKPSCTQEFLLNTKTRVYIFFFIADFLDDSALF